MTFEQRSIAAVASVGPSVVRVRSRRHRAHVASGIAWTEDRVVTAAHAVPREGTVELRLDDGTEREAEVVARDASLGIALVRVDGASLARPRFRDIASLSVGEPALALGRPGRSVRASLRIVGALGPEVRTPGGARIDRWIESDRGFPRGFEGGPLIDLDGTVIGMNTAAILRGADLAIPEPTLRLVVDDLERHGGVRRGYLGVAVQTVRLPPAARTGQETGIIVLEVSDDGPAAKAGLLLGDVILAIEGSPTETHADLAAQLRTRADATVTATILRAGAVSDVPIALGAKVG